MYAIKRCQKQFHNAHIKTKDLKVGDLVLAYTLKQHTSKLKWRGMGPYVIHDISTSGALRLATLDGEQMPSWINGCGVKKYYKPLTYEMMEWLHKSKERKKRGEHVKEQAQIEAKERERKHKNKWVETKKFMNMVVNKNEQGHTYSSS